MSLSFVVLGTLRTGDGIDVVNIDSAEMEQILILSRGSITAIAVSLLTVTWWGAGFNKRTGTPLAEDVTQARAT